MRVNPRRRIKIQKYDRYQQNQRDERERSEFESDASVF
jgi:hypothetical protein